MVEALVFIIILYFFLTLFFTIYKVIEEYENTEGDPNTILQNLHWYMIEIPIVAFKKYLKIHLVMMMPLFLLALVIAGIAGIGNFFS